MLGIKAIASYLPEGRISNYARKQQFDIDDQFIEEKIGFRAVARMAPHENTSTLCVQAYGRLQDKAMVASEKIQAVCVVTQNPDSGIPHVSAMLHGLLGLQESCACFDMSLGCSGWVHGLALFHAFMSANGMQHGLLFTADPYSKVIDEADKNTALLFGDGATVTYVSTEPVFVPGKSTYGTLGADSAELCTKAGKLYMNGRAIFNFAARHVPQDVQRVLALNGLSIDAVDRFVLHQGSKYILDALVKRLRIKPEKVPFAAAEYGNTVSSSVPMVLESEMENAMNNVILVCGFGVGLSWSSTVLTRNR